MKERYDRINVMLDALEAELRSANIWDAEKPSEEALRSIEPFAVDKLSFNQWLQFIFIQRVRATCEQKGSLPGVCSISPMAEEFYQAKKVDASKIIKLLASIDDLITNA